MMHAICVVFSKGSMFCLKQAEAQIFKLKSPKSLWVTHLYMPKFISKGKWALSSPMLIMNAQIDSQGDQSPFHPQIVSVLIYCMFICGSLSLHLERGVGQATPSCVSLLRSNSKYYVYSMGHKRKTEKHKICCSVETWPHLNLYPSSAPKVISKLL